MLKITYLAKTGSHVFLQQQSTLILPRRELSDHKTKEMGTMIKNLSSYLMLPVSLGIGEFCPLMAVLAHDGHGMAPCFVILNFDIFLVFLGRLDRLEYNSEKLSGSLLSAKILLDYLSQIQAELMDPSTP